MKEINRLLLFLLVIVCSKTNTGFAQSFSGQDVSVAFKKMLARPVVDLAPRFTREKTDHADIERGTINTEAGEKVPVLIYRPPAAGSKPLPVVICLHGTGGSKDQADITNFMLRFVMKGFMAVAIDARFHGQRIAGGAHGSAEYINAIIAAYNNSDSQQQQHPFFYDTVYDLWRLTDYLCSRPDVQKDRIGMMGISMGGIETWMAASVDKRIKVAVPLIAAQSFRWSLENDMWQGRARTVWAANLAVARERGDTAVRADDVKKLWNKVVPGITGPFDCPSMIRLFAPRPLLLLSAEKDMNCPLGGAELAFRAAREAYQSNNVTTRLKIHVTPDETHHLIPEHIEMAVDWFVKWL